jgi:hypothetical protein
MNIKTKCKKIVLPVILGQKCRPILFSKDMPVNFQHFENFFRIEFLLEKVIIVFVVVVVVF